MAHKYRVFTRTWWKLNPTWPNGLEPDGGARKTTLATVDTIEQARAYCAGWFAERFRDEAHYRRTMKRHLGRKAEFEEIGA